MKYKLSLLALMLLVDFGHSFGSRSAEQPFIATDEWQEIGPDQAIPRGLHVRMNLQTGRREAKLLSENKSGSEDHFNSLALTEPEEKKPENPVTIDEIREALKKLKSEDGMSVQEQQAASHARKDILRDIKKLKKEMEQLDMQIETDQETLLRLTKPSSQLSISTLEQIKALVHQIDNGLDFVKMGGVQKIIKPSLNATDVSIQEQGLLIIASASQNNPKVQIHLLKHGVLNDLLRIAVSSNRIKIISRAVHAISCLVRGFPYGQQVLVENGGISVFRDILLDNDWNMVPLQTKVMTLVNDLLDERQWAHGGRLTQLLEVPLSEHLYANNWCHALVKFLERASVGGSQSSPSRMVPDDSMVMTAMHSFKLFPECAREVMSSLLLFRDLRHHYDNLFIEDESSYSREIREEIKSVLRDAYRQEL